MLDRTKAPASVEITDFSFPKAERLTIGAGLPFFVVNSPLQDVICLQVVFKAGKYYQAQKAAASFTANLMATGTRSKNAKSIADKLDYYGAYLDMTPGTEYISAELYCMRPFFHELIGLFHELLTEAAFPEDEMENYRNRRIQELKMDLLKNSFVAKHKMRALLFGPAHPYGGSADEHALTTLERGTVLEHYRQKVQGQASFILASGNVGQAERALIEKHFSGFSVQARVNREQQLFQPSEIYRYAEEKEGAVQTSLRISKKLFPKTHPDFIKFEVLNEVLGGYFGSRLMSNLREEKGLTYGISSGIATFPETGYFVVSADVLKTSRDLAISEIHKEIDLLKNEPVGADELETVKNYMSGSFLKSANTAFARASLFREQYLDDLPEDYHDTFISKIKSVTAEDLLETARKHLSGPFYETVIG